MAAIAWILVAVFVKRRLWNGPGSHRSISRVDVAVAVMLSGVALLVTGCAVSVFNFNGIGP